MEAIHILLKQLFILAIIIGIGAAGSKLKIIRQKETDALERIIFYVTLPLLIVTSIWGLDTTPELLQNSLYTILFSYISLLILYGLAKSTGELFRFSDNTKPVYLFHTIFGNSVFIGFPLIKSFFPQEGIFYATIYVIVGNTVVWTYGISLLQKQSAAGVWGKLKELVNPHTVAFLVGFFFMFANIGYPDVVKKSFGTVGNATIYLSMLYLGAILSQIRIKGLFKRSEVFLVSINKLIIGPVLLIVLIEVTSQYLSLQLGNVANMVLILETGMPCMITGVVLVRSFGRDEHFASANVFVSTLLCLITLPLIYYLAQIISF